MTTSFICSECSRTFQTQSALNAHGRTHNSKERAPPTFETRFCEHTGKNIQLRWWDKHVSLLRTCQNPKCGKVFKEKANSEGKFCGHSCSAKVNNLERGPVSEQQKQKTSESLIKSLDRVVTKKQENRRYSKRSTTYVYPKKPRAKSDRPRKPHSEKNFLYCQIEHVVCPECGANFFRGHHNLKRKTCSKKCGNSSSSRIMMDKIIAKGTTNFSTKQPGFTYKHITIDCDSRLETAGVIYLVDILGAIKIDRCTSILNFKDDDSGNHRYLPDFYVTTAIGRYLVEVKQVRSKSPNINLYNRFFEHKKIALFEFCIAKNLQCIWLDFDYDNRFRSIYRQVLEGKFT